MNLINKQYFCSKYIEIYLNYMNRIKNLIENGYTIDGLNIYNETFQTYKKMVLPAGMIIFLIMIILTGIYTTVLFTYFNNPKEITDLLESFSVLNLSPANLLIYILVSAGINALFSIVSAGFLKMARDVFHDHLPKFGTVFKYFTKVEGIKIFIFTFIFHIVYSLISIFLELYGLSLAGLFVFILMHLLTILVIPFILFDKLSIIEALRSSVMLVNQHPFKIMSYLIFMASLSLFGFLIFFIGIIFTIPLFFCFNYCLYNQIIEKN